MSSLAPAPDVPLNIMAPPTAPLSPPLPEAIYPDSTAAKAALQEHAQVNSYGIGILIIIDSLVESCPQAFTTTQLSVQRLQGVLDTY
jgi:hypothetical protein